MSSSSSSLSLWSIGSLETSSVDPGTIFIRKDVQDLLLNITGFDLSRIFRQRTNKNFDRIVYKYLTDKQLKEVRVAFVFVSNDWLVFE